MQTYRKAEVIRATRILGGEGATRSLHRPFLTVSFVLGQTGEVAKTITEEHHLKLINAVIDSRFGLYRGGDSLRHSFQKSASWGVMLRQHIQDFEIFPDEEIGEVNAVKTKTAVDF